MSEPEEDELSNVEAAREHLYVAQSIIEQQFTKDLDKAPDWVSELYTEIDFALMDLEDELED